MNKIKQMSWIAWNWLMLSSADSSKLSATIKGSATFTILSVVASLLHINGVSDLTDSVINFIVIFGQFASAVIALVGALRKVKRTVGGTNAVLLDQQI